MTLRISRFLLVGATCCAWIVLTMQDYCRAASPDASTPPAIPAEDPDHYVECHNGVVVSVSGPASDVGRDILKRGGNAVDAAIATAFALQVAYPLAGNIAGGGFMLIHPAPGGGDPVTIDYRECARRRHTDDVQQG